MKKVRISERSTWFAPGMRPYDNRSPLAIFTDPDARYLVPVEQSNVVGSRCADTAGKTRRRHLPIVDLDYPHVYRESSTPGHAHLLLDVEISQWRWVLLMLGLWVGGVVSRNYMLWSFRRMCNYGRQPWQHKQDERENSE